MFHIDGGTRDRKLVCDRPFVPVLRSRSSPRSPHFYIVERYSPTTVRRRFILTQEGLSRVIPVVRSQEME